MGFFEGTVSQPIQLFQYTMIASIIQARRTGEGKYFALIRPAGNQAAGEGEHQVKAAARAVHVQDFSGGVQPRTEPALQGMGIKGRRLDAAGGHLRGVKAARARYGHMKIRYRPRQRRKIPRPGGHAGAGRKPACAQHGPVAPRRGRAHQQLLQRDPAAGLAAAAAAFPAAEAGADGKALTLRFDEDMP